MNYGIRSVAQNNLSAKYSFIENQLYIALNGLDILF